MGLAMAPHYNCITFNDPIKALNHANHLNSVDWNAHTENNYLYCSDSEEFIKNTLNLSVHKLKDTARFNEISVVVVDYDMPEMNGIEFCQKIKNPNIKRILLTGQASPSEAVEAFNDNVINYYINKSDADLYKHLKSAIAKLQNRYFLDISSYIKIRAIESKKSLFTDSALSQYFSQILADNNVEEYYFLTNPPRYKLRSEDGSTSEFLVYSRHDLNEQIRILKEEAGPRWLIDCLKTEKCVPYFHSTDGYYDPETFDEKSTVYPAEVVEGKDKFFCAHITDRSVAFEPTSKPNNSLLH